MDSGALAAVDAEGEGHEAFGNYRNPRDSTATLPSPKGSPDASDDTTENKLEVDDREVACDEAAASPPSSLDIDGWRIGSKGGTPVEETEQTGGHVAHCREDAEGMVESSGNALKEDEVKQDAVVGYRKRKSECLQIEVPEPEESSNSFEEGLCSGGSKHNIAEPSLKRSRPLSTEELEMMEIAQYHAARVRERSRTERFRRKTLVAKAADTPLTAGILPCSTMKLTVPLEPKLHTAARALGTGYTPRSETPKDVVDQADGLAVAAEKFSSRLREASNLRWSGKPTVPISPKLAHMRSRSRPMGTVSRIRQTAAPGAGSLRNSSRDTETSAASTDGRDHEGDDGPRAVESLAVETESFSNRLRESSGSRWTGRPTIPSSPRFSRAKAWRHPGLNQSAVEFERFTRHPLGPGTPSHSQDTPRVGTTLREEAERFTKQLRENVASLKWTGRITVPKSPNLSHNRGGSRVNTTFCMADSRALNGSGLETSFKARPAPSSTRRPHAVPLGPLRASTKPESPNLRTRIRSEIAPSRIGDDAENDRYKFIARPVPRRILEEVQFTVDLGPEKVTVPQGPEFNTEKRSLERSMQKSFISSDESAVSSAKYNDISSIPVTGDEDATTTSELSTSHPL